MKKFLLPLLCAFFLTCICVCYCKAQWVEVADLPYVSTSISFDSAGNRFVSLQQGHILKNQDTILTLPVHFVNEKGIATVLSDEHYLYIHYTGNDDVQRTIRYDTISQVTDTLVSQYYPGIVHVGGGLALNDSLLFSGFGYGGIPSDAQDSSSLRGKIVVTNLNQMTSSIYAVGARNPFRLAWDEDHNRLIVADVGSDIAEEVNILYGGENTGWNLQEGDSCIIGTCEGLTYPVFSYSQSQPRYIIGGEVFNNEYYFSDGGSGKGYKLSLDSTFTATPVEYPKDLTDFAINPVDGRLYAISWIGKIYRYEELPLALDSIEKEEYHKDDYYDWWLESLIERYGDVWFDVSGRAYLKPPTSVGYYYSVVRKQWKFITE
jgi:hypothetical protein